VIAERYRTFADLEARGSSPSYEAWSLAVAGDRDLLARLATLPARKQQPNLVFAGLPSDLAAPQIVWRAGVDVNRSTRPIRTPPPG
jgi:Uncharacterized protein conserved in bacteria (DUF2332)